MRILKLFIVLILAAPLSANAQIGQHRNDLSVGVNAGYVLSNVGFDPKVSQSLHGGLTGGLSFRWRGQLCLYWMEREDPYGYRSEGNQQQRTC